LGNAPDLYGTVRRKVIRPPVSQPIPEIRIPETAEGKDIEHDITRDPLQGPDIPTVSARV